MRMSIMIAAMLTAWLRLVWASGCFGGSPDITPRNGSPKFPSNGRVTIAGRSAAGVSWVGPDGRQIKFREQRIGPGPSATRILTNEAPLQPGIHTLQTRDPDGTQTFRVVPVADVQPPQLSGPLTLDAFNTTEPSSECPENIFIRARFRGPHDDVTEIRDLTYRVWIQRGTQGGADAPDLVLSAESIVAGEVSFRFGKSGCGCIPPFELKAGARYEVQVQAVDAAGHGSKSTLSGEVTIPTATIRR